MSTRADDWRWLRSEIRSASHALANQLRAVADHRALVPGLDWNVGELAASRVP